MKDRLKKSLLGIVVSICLLSAGYRLYKTYYKYYPVANAGECLSIEANGGKYKIHVIRNDKDSSIITVDFYTILGKVTLPGKASYADLRNYHATKVSCDEAAD